MSSVSRSTLLQELPAYMGAEKLISQNQGVYDIMKEIGNTHQMFAADYEKISKFFDTGEIESTCNKIFKYCKANIAYKIETEDKQSTRSPAAIVAIASGDCKHYSLFIAGILDAIRRTTGKRIDWSYRFSSYKFWDPIPHHVFVVVQTGSNEIWIDPVLSYFNEKKLYTSAISRKISTTMPLVRMSGTENENIGSLKTVAKKVVAVVKKVSVAIPRNAFLSLIALNVHGMATKLLATLRDPAKRPKLQSTWEKLGGSFNAFEQTINSGAKKKKILGIDDNTMISGYVSGGQVGVVQVAAVLAAAAPIIAALAAFLKGGEQSSPALEDITTQAIETVKQDVKQTGTAQITTATSSSGEKKTMFPGVPNIAVYAAAGLGIYALSQRK